MLWLYFWKMTTEHCSIEIRHDKRDAWFTFDVFNWKWNFRNFLTPNVYQEPYSLNNEVTSFDLECASNTVYLCYNNNKFSSIKLFDKKDPTPLPMIHALNCSGMAIEWVTGKLFLADKGSSELESDGRILVIDLKKPSLMSHVKMGKFQITTWEFVNNKTSPNFKEQNWTNCDLSK